MPRGRKLLSLALSLALQTNTEAVLLTPRAKPNICRCPTCAAAALEAAISSHLLGPSGEWYSSKAEDEELTGGTAGSAAADASEASALAVRALFWYKRNISPLLPPGCRFVPTCSEYAIDSFKAFPIWQAAILTVWRLIRCNPTAGFGLDVPQWPPPGYWAGSKQVRTPLDDEESRRKALMMPGDPFEASTEVTRQPFGDPLGVTDTAPDVDGLNDAASDSARRQERKG